MEFKKLSNNKGFMILEIIIAMGILGASALVLHYAVSSTNKNILKNKINKQSKDVVTEMINTFTSSAELMQINYAPGATFENELPIAWDSNGEKMLVSKCGNDCPLKGRLGVIIVPTPNKKIYLLKVRLTHPTWKDAKVSQHLVGTE